MYDASIARWNGVDALANDPNQIDKSPYAYAWNNPTNLTDPDGNCPLCGFIIGAALDYGTQVAVNKLKGKSWGDALTQVDKTSIVVSGGAGAIGVGIAKNIKNLGTLAKVGVEVTSDAAISITSQAITEKEVTVENVVLDVVTGQAGRRTAGKYIKNKAADSKTGQKLQQEVNRQNNIARGKSNTAKKSKANVKKALNDKENYVAGQGALGAGVAAGSVRRAVKEIKNDGSAPPPILSLTAKSDNTNVVIMRPIN